MNVSLLPTPGYHLLYFRLENCAPILVDAKVWSPGQDECPNLEGYLRTDAGGVTTSPRTVRSQLQISPKVRQLRDNPVTFSKCVKLHLIFPTEMVYLDLCPGAGG